MRLFTTSALASVALSVFAASPSLAQQQAIARPAVRIEIVDEGSPAYTANALPLTLRTTVLADTTVLANIPATWESSDPTRAWVSPSGTVVFLREGHVTVTARRGLATASRTFDVQGNPAARVALAAPARVRVGQGVRVTAAALDEQGRVVEGDRVNFGVTPAGATIDDRGDFVAREPGTYTLLAEVNGKADSRTIVVDGAAAMLEGTPAAARLDVLEPRFTAYVGTSVPLSADLWAQDARDAQHGASAQWSVDRADLASISPDGVLTALAPGRVTVTARAGQAAAQRTIRVYPNPTARITMSAFEHHLAPGETLRVSVDPLAPGARTLRDVRVVYGVTEPGSRDGVHASITDDGRFVATRPGVYTIFAAVGDKADQQTLLVQ